MKKDDEVLRLGYVLSYLCNGAGLAASPPQVGFFQYSMMHILIGIFTSLRMPIIEISNPIKRKKENQ